MTLKVRFVTKIDHQLVQSLLGGSKSVAVPVGTVHIFEAFRVAGQGGKSVEEVAAYSLCARSRSEIGQETKDTDKRPAGLGMCPDCEAAWKEHPSSAWKVWMDRVVLVLIFALLLTGCMQPVSAMPAAGAALPTAVRVDLAPTEAPMPTVSPTATLKTVCFRVIADESLHVRAKPDYESAVQGYLYHGDIVAVRGLGVDGWLPISEGWVRAKFVEDAPCQP